MQKPAVLGPIAVICPRMAVGAAPACHAAHAWLEVLLRAFGKSRGVGNVQELAHCLTLCAAEAEKACYLLRTAAMHKNWTWLEFRFLQVGPACQHELQVCSDAGSCWGSRQHTAPACREQATSWSVLMHIQPKHSWALVCKMSTFMGYSSRSSP